MISELDMSDALVAWEALYTIYVPTITKVRYIETEVLTETQQLCFIQTEDKENINVATLDHSLEYIHIGSRSRLTKNTYVVYNGKNYKLREILHAGNFGYWSAVAEEYKKTLEV